LRLINKKLKFLTNPARYSDFLNLGKFKKDKLIYFLSMMIKIRLVEEHLAMNKKNNIIKSPVHLCNGQEAIATAIGSLIKKGDTVFGNHRSHHHIISLNTNLKFFFSEILAKKNGLNKGNGASMHLIDKSNSFYGSVPIVAGTIPLATGAAFSLKYQKKKNISIIYMGDGASEEGVFHESLNFASYYKLPLLFVVENNFYSSNLHISQRQPSQSISRFALANKIKFKMLDGNNVLEIYNHAQSLINAMRKNYEPVLIEVFTYRQLGHVDWREDLDVGVDRSKEKLILWKKKDPIIRLLRSLIKNKFINMNFYNDIKNKINTIINRDWEYAIKSPDLKERDLTRFVYHEE
jgi:pyruvate dehydrogenase E1 component alpha subunit